MLPRKLRVQHLMLAPTVILLLGLGIFPLVFGLYLSTMRYNLLQPIENVKPVGAANYVWALTDDLFWRTLQVSMTFMVTAVTLEFVLGLALAVLAARVGRGGPTIRSLLAMPLFVTAVVTALMFKLMMDDYFGIFNYFLGLIGLQGIGWLSDPAYALFSIILADIWSWTPFVFLVLFAAVESVPRDQYESSSIDGASAWSQFRLITLPWIIPAAIVVILIRAVDVLKETDKIYMMTYGGPGGFTTATLAFYIYYHGVKEWAMGESTALAFILVVIINILVMLIYRVLRRR